LKPLISVVIPVFNREDLIKKSIQSILDQEYSELELIVVDDYSTDKSREKVREFSDSRIKLIELKENGGNAKSRNEGWKNAQGEWVAYLDSDDWFEPDYLTRLVEAIDRNPESGFFWTGVRYVDKYDAVIKEEIWNPKEELPSTTFFDELRIGTNCGVAFRKELLERYHGFDESFRASVDREFFLRISRTEIGKGIPYILVNCLMGDHESVRKDSIAQATAYRQLIDRYSKEIIGSLPREKWWNHKAMWLSLYNGDNLTAFGFLKKLNYAPKSLILLLIFQLVPLSLAKKIHKKLA
jgi:glycosyltransferase involved in cell wall biosynthesis